MISLMIGAVLNYLTRSTLSVAAPTLLKKLKIGPQEYSWINGTFQGMLMLQPACGYVADMLQHVMPGYSIQVLAIDLKESC